MQTETKRFLVYAGRYDTYHTRKDRRHRDTRYFLSFYSKKFRRKIANKQLRRNKEAIFSNWEYKKLYEVKRRVA